jgi:hypothetical protein
MYPQLYWEKEVKEVKEIKSYIFYLQNGIYRFIPYIYDGKIGYADHNNEKAFRFIETTSKFSIYDVLIDEDMINIDVPFPQADKFEKIQDMLFVISKTNCIKKEELNLEFDIVSRQIDYYFNVLKWLKVCKEENECLVLTKLGKEIIELPFQKRVEELAKIIFCEPIANNLLHNRHINQKLFARYKIYSQSTKERRLQTISAWITYFETIFK